eukprot:scaffold4071_cov217-Isochrysis_galbana.AAC.6
MVDGSLQRYLNEGIPNIFQNIKNIKKVEKLCSSGVTLDPRSEMQRKGARHSASRERSAQ